LGDLQWHNLHTKFCENRSTGSHTAVTLQAHTCPDRGTAQNYKQATLTFLLTFLHQWMWYQTFLYWRLKLRSRRKRMIR